MSDLCVCGSKKVFKKCCHRYLNTSEQAKTPEQLMRSRYAAFALGGYGDYLFDTWHPTMTQGLSRIELSQSRVKWLGLEIINKSQEGDSATVEFDASYLDNEGKVLSHHERSAFSRVAGRWLYVGGEVESS